MRYFLLVISVIFTFGCKSEEEQQQCLRQTVNDLKRTPAYVSVRAAAEEKVRHWVATDADILGGAQNTTEWRIDSMVFFNEDRSRALLLLLQKDLSSKAEADFIKVLQAENLEGEWQFDNWFAPKVAVPKGASSSSIDEFEQLSERARSEFIEGGYYGRFTCHTNYDFVDRWFREPK